MVFTRFNVLIHLDLIQRYFPQHEFTFLVRYGVVGNISACHADARGSIPRFGVFSNAIFQRASGPKNASIGTRTRILTLEGLNTTLVLWTQINPHILIVNSMFSDFLHTEDM